MIYKLLNPIDPFLQDIQAVNRIDDDYAYIVLKSGVILTEYVLQVVDNLIEQLEKLVW
ncbi:MAG: hypothetical protein JKY89_00290 [Immundisolibacteraceae bacterium]|nr:hypothetical protein [Immundisolibacteraceae bacterium]